MRFSRVSDPDAIYSSVGYGYFFESGQSKIGSVALPMKAPKNKTSGCTMLDFQRHYSSSELVNIHRAISHFIMACVHPFIYDM